MDNLLKEVIEELKQLNGLYVVSEDGELKEANHLNFDSLIERLGKLYYHECPFIFNKGTKYESPKYTPTDLLSRGIPCGITHSREDELHAFGRDWIVKPEKSKGLFDEFLEIFV